MERRFSIKCLSNEGVDNGGLQLQENGGVLPVADTINNRNLLSTTSTTCLYDDPPIQKRKRSLVQMTKEALPRLENYRNSRRALKRPSLGELHGGEDTNKVTKSKVCDVYVPTYNANNCYMLETDI